jgi:ATP-dependent DNA helicase DinG
MRETQESSWDFQEVPGQKSESETAEREIIDKIFLDGGVLSANSEHYKVRPSQVEAAHGIMDALINNSPSIVEGPCGFGKTYAYLIPVVLDIWNKYLHCADPKDVSKTVIATNGISLQEQLCTKDIPKIISTLECIRTQYYEKAPTPTFALLKGRQNFICPLKLTVNRDILKNNIPSEQFKEIENVNLTNGDLSSLSFTLPYEVRQLCVCSDANECKGGACSMAKECHYLEQKKKAAMSDIIVCNYHMLFSAIEAPVLPVFDTLIWDEAHEAVEIFRNLNIDSLSKSWISHLSGDITRLLNTRCGKEIVEQLVDTQDTVANSIFDLKDKQPQSVFIRELQDITQKYLRHITQLCGIQINSPFADAKLVHESFLDSTYHALKQDVVSSLMLLRSFISSTADLANTMGEDAIGVTDQEDCQSCVAIAETIEKSLTERIHFIERSDGEEMDYAYYIKKTPLNDDVALEYERMPIDVSKLMHDIFLSPTKGINNIFTSATLSVGGNMEFFKSEIGLNHYTENIFEFIGQSPFNLKEQELWYLPNPCVDGNKPDFGNYFNDTLEKVIRASGKGLLVLTTSVTAMNQAYAVATSIVSQLGRNTKVMRQNDKPRTKLLEEFKENGEAILIATKSFFTGIDIPGQALQCLVIDKLPFMAPNDPIVMHLNCKQNYNCFMDYQVPKMIIILKQAVGRGVRSINDRCVICVADGRMATSRYKGKIGKSFPYEKTATRNIDDVKNFLN